MKVIRLNDELFNSLLVIMDAGVKALGLKACADVAAILGAVKGVEAFTEAPLKVDEDPLPQADIIPPPETPATELVEEKEEDEQK